MWHRDAFETPATGTAKRGAPSRPVGQQRLGGVLGLCAVSALAVLLGTGCGDDDADADGGATAQLGGDKSSSWTLADTSTTATCPAGFTGSSPDVVSSVTVLIDGDMVTVTAEPCVSTQEGSLTLGESGFLSTLNEGGETAMLSCEDNAAGGFVCEHSWIDGEFELDRL